MWFSAAAAAKSLQSCLTLCDPMDCSLPGFSIPGILQARAVEWVAISFSNAWKWKVKVKSLSRVWLLVTSWTAAYQAPPSMGFSRQQYWSGVPLPSPMWLSTCSFFLCAYACNQTTFSKLCIKSRSHQGESNTPSFPFFFEIILTILALCTPEIIFFWIFIPKWLLELFD